MLSVYEYSSEKIEIKNLLNNCYMDKYTERLSSLPFDLLHIAQSFANDNNCPQIEPAHIMRALLHKTAGLVNYIEDTLDSDYYYLVDWAEMRIQQCDKSPYKMKGIEFSHEAKQVIKEAINIAEKCGKENIDGPCLLAALVWCAPFRELRRLWRRAV